MSSKTKEPDTVGQAIPFIPPDPALSIIQRLRVKRKIFQDAARRLFLLHLTLLGGGGAAATIVSRLIQRYWETSTIMTKMLFT